jgi:single-strand DNA-binding protein
VLTGNHDVDVDYGRAAQPPSPPPHLRCRNPGRPGQTGGCQSAGNLVEDPELRFTNTGIAVANLRVAVTQRIQQDCEWSDGDTSYLKVNVWRRQAEDLADSLAKGDRVMGTGRLRQRSWETPEGEMRSVAGTEADEVGASLKFATAKVERASERRPSDRSQGRERQAECGGDFNDLPPF